jgi:RimJ/RimL family protein N-acetyltransferase
MSELISFKELTGEPEELTALQELLNNVPDYTRRCRAEEQGACTPAELMQQIPEGVAPEQKKLYGIFFNHRMIGCLDLVKGYPDAKTAFVGILLIAEDVQGAGLGSEAFKECEKMIRSEEGFDRIRIGVMRTNDFVQNFWRKMGFRKTGDSQNFEAGSLRTKIFFMEKSLRGGFQKTGPNNNPNAKRTKKPHHSRQSNFQNRNNNNNNHNNHNNNNNNNNHPNNNERPQVEPQFQGEDAEVKEARTPAVVDEQDV